LGGEADSRGESQIWLSASALQIRAREILAYLELIDSGDCRNSKCLVLLLTYGKRPLRASGDTHHGSSIHVSQELGLTQFRKEETV
jgi:hypothetical protein